MSDVRSPGALGMLLSLVPAGLALTQPFADKLSGFLVNLLGMFGHGEVSALPGLLTAAIVIFLTKATNDVVANMV